MTKNYELLQRKVDHRDKLLECGAIIVVDLSGMNKPAQQTIITSASVKKLLETSPDTRLEVWEFIANGPPCEYRFMKKNYKISMVSTLRMLRHKSRCPTWRRINELHTLSMNANVYKVAILISNFAPTVEISLLISNIVGNLRVQVEERATYGVARLR
nr:hypothetical protein [Tanacetum cinerariifolium]